MASAALLCGVAMYKLNCAEYFEKNRGINVLPRFPQESFPEHCHDFHELVLVRSGCGIHVCNGRAVHVSRGCVLYLRENDTHLFDKLENLCLTNVLFIPRELRTSTQSVGLLAEICRSDSARVLLGDLGLARAEALLLEIRNEFLKGDACSSLMIETLFSQLMVVLWRDLQESRNGGRARQCGLMPLIQYVNENFGNEINWSALSARFAIPLRTLNRKMLAHTGLAPNQYLARIRLCHASYLLSHSSAAVTDIAFSCGFNDSNYFSSRFHKAFDMSPMQYRNRYCPSEKIARRQGMLAR